jgi:hypothetical protein
MEYGTTPLPAQLVETNLGLTMPWRRVRRDREFALT